MYFLAKCPYLVLLLSLTVEMIPDEQEHDETSETQDKSRDGEDKGEEHCIYPDGGVVGLGLSDIVTEESVNY